MQQGFIAKPIRYRICNGPVTSIFEAREQIVLVVDSPITREAEGLFDHETILEIDEHSADTGGAGDHVFALFALIGKRFAQRLRNGCAWPPRSRHAQLHPR